MQEKVKEAVHLVEGGIALKALSGLWTLDFQARQKAAEEAAYEAVPSSGYCDIFLCSDIGFVIYF